MTGIGVGIGFALKTGAAAKKALSMNGTSDHLKTPTLTYTKIVVDAIWNLKTNTYQDYWGDASLSNAIQRTSGNVDHIVGAAATAYLNGTAKTDNTAYVPNGTRCSLEVDYTASATYAINFCSSGGGSSLFTQATLYDIKIYNGATLVAHYDMSTGTVNDQSGSGNNATLTGGTWINV